MTTDKQTHLTKVDQTPRNYFGICYYDDIGNSVQEIGHHDKETFERMRDDSDRSLIGKWCYALLKTRNISDVWSCAIVFPDGDIKVLKKDQVAVSAPKSCGKWMDYNAVINVANKTNYTGPLRFAMDSRIPWKNSAVTLKVEKFKDQEALAKWILAKDPVRSVIFVANPSKTNLPPNEEALFVLCAVVDA